MLRSIINTFNNCFKIPELKSRIWFTMLLLGICRLSAYVRIPGLDGLKLSEYIKSLHGMGTGGVRRLRRP